MKRYQPGPFPTRPQFSFYGVISLVGGLIRNTSLLMLILCFGFATAVSAVATAKSFWNHLGVRSFVAALEADLATLGSSTVDLKTQPPPQNQYKDMAKVQREENRARRELAAELKQRKSSASSSKAAWQNGRRI